MARTYYYTKTISNSYLGQVKEVKAATIAELNMKVYNQLAKWEEQERRQRERNAIADLKAKAEFDTQQAEKELEQYRNILASTLHVNDRLDWETFYDRKPFRTFTFDEPEPTYDQVCKELGVPPKRGLLEAFIKSLATRRQQKEEQARITLAERLTNYEERKRAAIAEYDAEKAKYEKQQQESNNAIDQFKAEFEHGVPNAIEKYVRLVLKRSIYPAAVSKEFDVQFDPSSGAVIIAYLLPSPSDIPRVTQYRFVASRKEIVATEMKPKEFDQFYESIIFQIALRTIHEVFESVYINDVKSVVFNGWVKGVDPATGKDFTSCILSVQAAREVFQTFNLERLSPKECIRSLKGLFAGPLAQLAPVKPIMDINRDDDRFIEAREVLAKVNSTSNLATMDWADFEHLVRELFEKIFSADGAEVKVTQASRDGGVDAVAFDPDPIRGGKFVIQAKRYNDVVPLSAVRDLYGTMINEGAVKGILVTTSYYGPDARDFVKDKPITLIDGANLVHLFQQHGHDVRIELQKRAK